MVLQRAVLTSILVYAYQHTRIHSLSLMQVCEFGKGAHNIYAEYDILAQLCELAYKCVLGMLTRILLCANQHKVVALQSTLLTNNPLFTSMSTIVSPRAQSFKNRPHRTFMSTITHNTKIQFGRNEICNYKITLPVSHQKRRQINHIVIL